MDGSELRAELEKHHRESYGWALSCCAHSRSEADNVVQAVYLKVLEGKARFEGKSAFKTWLFAVIRITANEERRWQTLRQVWLKRSPKAEAAVESPETTVYRNEIRNRCRSALALLPRRQREVLQLVFYHELSLSEAAAVMSVSLGSARSHYERGKRRLRQIMFETGFYDGKRAGRDNPGVVPTTEGVR